MEDTTPKVTLEEATKYYREHAVTKNNGVIDIPKSAFTHAMKEHHGVTQDEMKRIQTAVDFETTAAACVARDVLLEKIAETSKEDLDNDEFRRKMSATVRLPTFGGSTELEMFADRAHPIPFRNNADGSGERELSITHGELRTTINAERRIEKSFHEDTSERIKKALGLV